MVVPDVVAQKDRALRPYWGSLVGIVRDTVLPFCESNRFGFDIRVKETESIAEKIESGRYSSWDELDDLVACAVVVPSYAYEAGVLEFLRTAFEEESSRVRGAAKKMPDVFRFDSTRFVGKLRHQPELHRAPEIEQTLFEVQIRSAFEHAWSTTTHALVYKSATVDWRKHRLAAQLKAAVEQIDLLIQGFEGSAELIDPSPWPELQEQEALQALLEAKFAEGALPTHLLPKDWSRVVSNIHGLLRASARSRDGTAERVRRALESLDAEFTVARVDDVPVSCSLWQVVAGTLTEREVLVSPPQRFTPFVTEPMLTFFPTVEKLGRGFSL